MNIFERDAEGKIKLNDVAVLSCGCGSVVPDTRNQLRMAGVPDVAIVMTTTNPKIQQYIRQIGLDSVVKSLHKPTHSVLYNPFTGQWIDLLKSPHSQQVFENIYKVARGEQS